MLKLFTDLTYRGRTIHMLLTAEANHCLGIYDDIDDALEAVADLGHQRVEIHGEVRSFAIAIEGMSARSRQPV